MLLQDKVDSQKPYVIYKQPRSGKLFIYQQKDGTLYQTKGVEAPGFYFAPFDLDKYRIVIFPDEKSSIQSYFIRNFELDQSNPTVLLSIETNEAAHQTHLKKVHKAIDLINEGFLQKMVISRKQEVDYDNFNPFNALLKLMTTYDNSFVYLWHHPKIGFWLGATPEVLLQSSGDIIKTMALAGTLPVKSNEPVTWQTKEIKEQQFVTDEIVSKLKKYSQDITVGLPRTIFQGHLAHIRTDISASIPKKQLSSLIFDLHPTPAVCGLPTNKAKNYIDKIEAYDRAYYTGFLGFKDLDEIALYVNLRSLSFHENKKKLNIYVGGGIVADSNSEKEWAETLIKSDILLSMLKF